MADLGEGSALGDARRRFMQGLRTKTADMGALVRELSVDGSSDRVRDELRRRLHALYASAQVFRLSRVASELKGTVDTLDAAIGERRATTREECGRISRVLDSLDELSDGVGASAAVSSGPPPASPSSSPASSASWVPPSAFPPSPSSRPVADPAVGASAFPSSRPYPHAPSGSSLPPSGDGRSTLHGVPSQLPPAKDSDSPEAQTVRVLLVDRSEDQHLIRRAFEQAPYEFILAHDGTTALHLAKIHRPDLILVDGQAAGSGRGVFVQQMRSEPAAEFVPMVMMLSEGMSGSLPDVDAVLVKPLTEARVLDVSERLLGVSLSARHDLPDFEGERLGALSRSITGWFRHAFGSGSSALVQVPSDMRLKVRATVWRTVCEVDAMLCGTLTDLALVKGQGYRRVLPLPVGFATREAEHRDPEVLANMRFAVVDADPAVRWFIASLLRELGAEVREATDTREGYAQCRGWQVDGLVVSSELSGDDAFEMARWFGDSLSLGEALVFIAGLAPLARERIGAMRAEGRTVLAGSVEAQWVTGRIVEGLSPWRLLQEDLRTGAVVRGHLDAVGALRLLRLVCRLRPESSLVIRTPWNEFEVTVRDGSVSEIICTGVDGSFVRGGRAFGALVSESRGRFRSARGDSGGRHSQARTTRDADGLAEEMAHILAVRDGACEAITDPRADRVELDQSVATQFARARHPWVQQLVRHIRSGKSCAELGEVIDMPLDAVRGALVGLARWGAVTSVQSRSGEALSERAVHAWQRAAKRTSDADGFDTGTGSASTSGEAELNTPAERDDVFRVVEDMQHDTGEAMVRESMGPQASKAPLLAVGESLESRDSDGSDWGPTTDPSTETRTSFSPTTGLQKVAPVAVEPTREDLETMELSGFPAGPRRRMGWVWAVSVGLLAALGISLWQLARLDGERVRDGRLDPEVVPGGPGLSKGEAPEGAVPSFGQVLAHVPEQFVHLVGDGQGLLIVKRRGGDGDEITLKVSGGLYAEFPVHVALDEGRHELVFDRGEHTSYRYIYVREGETRVVTSP